MSIQYVMQRDTRAWRTQVQVAFGLSVLCAGLGVVQMPGQELDRAFLAIGMFFCLFATFSVAKTQRDNRDGQVDTVQWMMTVWIGFVAAVLLTGWGLWRMQIDIWQKYYMLVSWLFLVSSAFTLSKTIRDAQEADLLSHSANSTLEAIDGKEAT
jgi:hypothetical protein